MANITLRQVKGSALTFAEADSNFTNLNTDKLELLSQDPAPQLGGNLIVNGNQIRAEGEDSVALVAGGTGSVMLATQLGSNVSLTANGAQINRLLYDEKIHDLGTISGTITPNINIGNVQKITLNGNLTLNSFLNAQPGQSLTLIIETNGTDRTLTSSMKFAGGDKTLSTTNTIDILSVFFDGTTYFASISKNFN